MARRKPPKLSPNSTLTADAFIRQAVEVHGSIGAIEKEIGLYPCNLRVWLYDPDRNFSPDVALRVAAYFGLPCEAVLRRWTPIKDLNIWNLFRDLTGDT